MELENPMSSSSYTPRQVEYNSEKYNILIHIECSEIIFQIASINTNPNKIFDNSFSLERLVGISQLFMTYNTLDKALEFLNGLINLNRYTIRNDNENDNIIYFCFLAFPPFQNKDIEIPLKKKKMKMIYHMIHYQMK